MKSSLRILLTACVFGCAMTVLPARAGLFDDDEARNRIESLRKEVAEQAKRLETVSTTANNVTRTQFELNNQIEQLKADLSKIRGQIEVLTYELDATQKRQKDFYVDLDNRLRKLESAAAVAAEKPAATATSPTAAAADPAAEMRDYEAALTLFKGARYKEALAALLGFIKTYGSSSLQPSAHYWAASSHYQLHEFPKAAELFGKLAATWPADARAPDALLGQANSLRDGGDIKGARKTLETLVAKYPDSSAAQSARPRLKK